jgi:hypothetical protein
VLRTTGPVTLKVGTAGTELPNAGRADAVSQFTQDCTLD